MLYRRPRPAPKRPALAPPTLPGMVDEFRERPYLGASYGEMLPTPTIEPAAPSVPLRIEPWPEHERRAAMRDAEPEPPPSESAIAAMMRAARENGELPEPPPIGPAVQYAPVPKVVIPEPDWEHEQKLAVRRISQEKLEQARQLVAEAALDDGEVA